MRVKYSRVNFKISNDLIAFFIVFIELAQFFFIFVAHKTIDLHRCNTHASILLLNSIRAPSSDNYINDWRLQCCTQQTVSRSVHQSEIIKNGRINDHDDIRTVIRMREKKQNNIRLICWHSATAIDCVHDTMNYELTDGSFWTWIFKSVSFLI